MRGVTKEPLQNKTQDAITGPQESRELRFQISTTYHRLGDCCVICYVTQVSLQP